MKMNVAANIFRTKIVLWLAIAFLVVGTLFAKTVLAVEQYTVGVYTNVVAKDYDDASIWIDATNDAILAALYHITDFVNKGVNENNNKTFPLKRINLEDIESQNSQAIKATEWSVVSTIDGNDKFLPHLKDNNIQALLILETIFSGSNATSKKVKEITTKWLYVDLRGYLLDETTRPLIYQNDKWYLKIDLSKSSEQGIYSQKLHRYLFLTFLESLKNLNFGLNRIFIGPFVIKENKDKFKANEEAFIRNSLQLKLLQFLKNPEHRIQKLSGKSYDFADSVFSQSKITLEEYENIDDRSKIVKNHSADYFLFGEIVKSEEDTFTTYLKLFHLDPNSSGAGEFGSGLVDINILPQSLGQKIMVCFPFNTVDCQ